MYDSETRRLSLMDWQYIAFIGFCVLTYAVGTWTIGAWLIRLIRTAV